MLRLLTLLAVGAALLSAPGTATAETWAWDAHTGTLTGDLELEPGPFDSGVARNTYPDFPFLLNRAPCASICPTDPASVKRLVLRNAHPAELKGDIDASSWGSDSAPVLQLDFGYAGSSKTDSIIDLTWKSAAGAKVSAVDGAIDIDGDGAADIEMGASRWEFKFAAGPGDDIVDFSKATPDTALSVSLGAGNDVLRGAARGGTSVSGGPGADRIFGSPNGINAIQGDAGNDRLVGGSTIDQFNGGYGNDVLITGAGKDRVRGGAGNDVLDAGPGDDTLEGADGSDIMRGGAGNDTFFDPRGVNRVYGDAGNDFIMNGLIVGSTAADAKRSTIYCGAGFDTTDDAYPRRYGCERVIRHR